MIGNERANASKIDGMTNIPAWVRIMPTMPVFVRPTRRITPYSNVFDSTEVSSKEKTRKVATVAKMIKRMAKMRLMNIMA